MVSQGSRRPLLIAALVAAGCDSDAFRTEAGVFGVSPGLVVVPTQGPVVLEDSLFCPDVRYGYPADAEVTEWFLRSENCFDIIGRSTQRDEDGCFDLEIPAEEVFDISQRAQCASRHDYPDDELRVDVVPRDAVTAGAYPALEVFAPAFVDESGAPLPAASQHTLGAPLQVVENQRFAPLVLIVDDAGRWVAYDDERYPPMFSPHVGSYDEGEGEFAEEILLAPGTVVDVSLEHSTAPLPAGQLVAVPSSDVVSLELQVGYGRAEASDITLRAVARDVEGNLVFSAPVEWSASGVEVGLVPLLPDYSWVADDCVPPPDEPMERMVTVTVALGELRDTAEVRWIALPADPDDPPFERGEYCLDADADDDLDIGGPRGCACRSSGPSSEWWMLLVLAIARRRRRA